MYTDTAFKVFRINNWMLGSMLLGPPQTIHWATTRNGIVGSKHGWQQRIKAWSSAQQQHHDNDKHHCNYKHHRNSNKKASSETKTSIAATSIVTWVIIGIKHHCKQASSHSQQASSQQASSQQASSQQASSQQARKVIVGNKQSSLRCVGTNIIPTSKKRHCWNQTIMVALVGNKNCGNNRKQHCHQQEWFVKTKIPAKWIGN